MRNLVVLVALVVVSVAYGLTAVYKAEPVRADYSAWTDTVIGRRYVSEVVTLNVDSLGPPGYCELFSGQGGDAEFRVDVYSYPNGVLSLASGHKTEYRDNVWVRCTLDVAYPESLVKGRRCEFRWSRVDGSRIQFYWDAFAGTKYDSMIVPGGSFQPPPEPAA